jgi:hypothetical protein
LTFKSELEKQPILKCKKKFQIYLVYLLYYLKLAEVNIIAGAKNTATAGVPSGGGGSLFYLLFTLMNLTAQKRSQNCTRA